MFLPKKMLEVFAFAVTKGALLHLSGATGTGKTLLLHTIARCPENFAALCRALGLPTRPVKVHPIHMPRYETPSEVYSRRK